MKKTSSEKKLKEKKEPKLKKSFREENEIEEKYEEEKQEKSKDIIPEIDSDIEEEKQIIKKDFIPEGILDSDFQEELPSLIGKTKVSLDRFNFEKIGGFNLERFIENSPINQVKKQPWQEEFDPNSYISGIKNSDEPKYLSYDGNFNPVEKVKMNSLSAINEQKASIQFNPMIKQEEKSIETYVPAKRMQDSELRKKKDNFIDSSKEIKYTPSKY